MKQDLQRKKFMTSTSELTEDKIKQTKITWRRGGSDEVWYCEKILKTAYDHVKDVVTFHGSDTCALHLNSMKSCKINYLQVRM